LEKNRYRLLPAFIALCFSFTSLRAAEPTILSSNASPPTVGLEGRLEVLLPPDLNAVAADNKAPLLLRIASTRPHGSQVHYDLRYIGRVPGEHDLRDYLLTRNNQPATNLPSMKVEVIGILPEQHNGWLESQALQAPSVFGGYRGVIGAIIVLWALLVLPLFFWGRRTQPASVENPVDSPSLADRLKPLVERATTGGISADDQAELERLLIAFWQHKLNLNHLPGEQLIPKIREHEEAGRLLRALEDWLHRPPGSVRVNIDDLLEPYRHPSKRSEGPA